MIGTRSKKKIQDDKKWYTADLRVFDRKTLAEADFHARQELHPKAADVQLREPDAVRVLARCNAAARAHGRGFPPAYLDAALGLLLERTPLRRAHLLRVVRRTRRDRRLWDLAEPEPVGREGQRGNEALRCRDRREERRRSVFRRRVMVEDLDERAPAGLRREREPGEVLGDVPILPPCYGSAHLPDARANCAPLYTEMAVET